MLRLYVLVCSVVALLSLVPWSLAAMLAPGATQTLAQPGESELGVGLALALIWLYPAFLALFGVRSWRLYRARQYGAAAGPTTLIGLPAVALLIVYAIGRGSL